MDRHEISCKRSVLLSAQMRFSPEVQPVRETAIDKIVEQNLLFAQKEEGLTLNEINSQHVICFADGTPIIHTRDLKKSLNRLVATGRLKLTHVNGQARYRLSDKAETELWVLQQTTEERFKRVVNRLFAYTDHNTSVYTEPFLECLCQIFSRLGHTYVRLIKGEINHRNLSETPVFPEVIRRIEKKYPKIDINLFKYTLISFFQELDPDYDAIKWNMAQNYYVAKAIGLDPSGYLLSKEIFSNAIFYLDTNVIIHLLEPRARHYGSLRVLEKLCRNLHIKLNVCQISLNELNYSIEYNRELISKVIMQIPEELMPKIRGIFFNLYQRILKSKGSADFNEVFASFRNPKEVLEKDHNVHIIDDIWFSNAETELETTKLIETIRLEYRKRRKLNKKKITALHDALLLRWIQLERQYTQNTWLITLDTSLPKYIPNSGNSNERPLAITLDALLQWISPNVSQDDDDVMAAIFSEAVKYLLLPQDNFFDLRDFLVFADMEMSCRELPAEDVENCVRYLKSTGLTLDTSDPADREKLALQVRKFFADPGRKYSQIMHEMEQEIAAMKANHEDETDNYKRRISDLEKQIRERDQIALKRKEMIFFWIRVAVGTCLFCGCIGIAIIISKIYAPGTNIWRKIVNFWPLIAGGFAFGCVLFFLVLGKTFGDRLPAPIKQIMRNN